MGNSRRGLILLFLLLPLCVQAQLKVSGHIYDAGSRAPLPFATVKFDSKGHGTVAGLDGRFDAEVAGIGPADSAEVSYMGYEPQKIALLPVTDVYLQPLKSALAEVVVKPPYDKIRHILNQAIAARDANDPDKYDWYQCRVYYKMAIDVSLPDVPAGDTDREKKQLKGFLDNQHLLMSETYSRRTWKKPQQLQEDVLGTRVSGFRRSMFTSLVTDVLPFHSYSDYINLNGKDYHNPVSRGYEQYYKFGLEDELMQGADTVWVLSFRPAAANNNELRGTVYINSDGYAISDLIASSADTILKRNLRIEQQYERITANGERHWFPVQLNYLIDWDQHLNGKTGKRVVSYHLKGNSQIDSVSWKEQPGFRFDKAHTVKLQAAADVLDTATWNTLRPLALDAREARTYHVIDSFGQKKHFDQVMDHMARLPEAKVSLGLFDIDLKRFFSSNYYENFRLGAGMQTSDKWLKWLSVGGWAGYGFKDAHWKYGLFTELYADKARESVFRLSYTDDINDPGRIHMNSDLDKNYLNTYLLQRVDHVKTYTASVKKKFGYLGLELTARMQQIDPRYAYALATDGIDHNTFAASEVSLNFRYAFGERTAPFFGYYYPVSGRYPIWYGKMTTGLLHTSNTDIPYTQALTALLWHRHINRLGFEHFLVEGGASVSGQPLPLSKLFAGNGYRYDQGSANTVSIYTFGGFMTMYPYAFYSDRFASFMFRHDFDWKLYCAAIPGSSFSSAPFISLQYNLLYGKLHDVEAQKYVAFAVPDNAYHEAGLLLNNVLRANYVNLYYFTLNLGYFYHAAPGGTGKLVAGLGVEF